MIRQARIGISEFRTTLFLGVTQWVTSISPTWTWIGVQKHIRFSHAFPEQPQVSTAISLIAIRPPGTALENQVGYKPRSALERDLLRMPYIATDAAEISTEGFTLEVGIGLPSDAATALSELLKYPAVEPNTFAAMIAAKKFPPHDAPNDDEKWIMNFDRFIGTVDVTWTAQAPARPNTSSPSS